MNRAPLNHYVCDRCGNYWQAYREGECPACKNEAVWEFPPDRGKGAREQSAHIIAGKKSGLFREAKR